jgi:hypothetical protein
MSSSSFLLSLDIDRRACRRVPALIFCGVLLALTAVSLSGLAWQPRALVAALILACGLWELLRSWPGAPRYVTRIQVAPDGRFLLGTGRESPTLLPATPLPATLVHWWVLPGLAIGLAFVGKEGQRGQAILFRDRLAPDVWRRLLVRLRHGSGHGRG